MLPLEAPRAGCVHGLLCILMEALWTPLYPFGRGRRWLCRLFHPPLHGMLTRSRCFGEPCQMVHHHCQARWCSCSSFTPLDGFLLEYLQFSHSMQVIAIHKFLRKRRERIWYAVFSFTALILLFFFIFPWI